MHLTLYHGTRAQPFDQFRASERGTFGSGHYFTSDLHSASCSGKTRTTRPSSRSRWVSSGRTSSTPAKASGQKLVRDLFFKRAPALLAAAAAGNGQFGPEIEDELRRLGHDGVVCSFEDGSLEVNLLDPENTCILSWMSAVEAMQQLEAERPSIAAFGCRP